MGRGRGHNQVGVKGGGMDILWNDTHVRCKEKILHPAVTLTVAHLPAQLANQYS